MSTAEQRRAGRTTAHAVASRQAGIASRRQLYAAGVSRWQLRAELQARRWRRTGRQTVSVTTGELALPAQWWVAVLEVGGGGALDGVTALQAAGLTGITEDVLHVAVAKSSRPRKVPGVRVHETRRFCEADVDRAGLPRVRPAVAAVHAALWARTDRQAALFLAATVQQRLAPAASVAEAFSSVRRHRRRRFLLTVLADLVGGAESLGEIDFAASCRRRGLPEPDRQVVRRLPGGRAYLDVCWSAWGLVVEVDGVQHDALAHRMSDALRDNEQLVDGQVVLRIPVLGLRLHEDEFLSQVERALRRRGWSPASAA